MALTREALIASTQAAIDHLNAALTEQKDLLKSYQRMPSMEEPKNNGSVVKFSLRMRTGVTTKQYNYAAIRVAGRWFTTGHTCPASGYFWNDLWKWIGQHQLLEFEELHSKSESCSCTACYT